MAFFASMRELLELGDPTIRSWPLVPSVWTPFILSALYVFFVRRLGPYLMRHREPFDLRKAMTIYNFSIVAIYTYSLCKLAYLFFATECGRLLCAHLSVIEGTCIYEACAVGWINYIIKYIEFADTVFFVLRKKFHLITHLHVVHHAALPIIVWFMLRVERTGFQFLSMSINSFVHIIMYTYYGLSAMGPEIQKILWWKEYLTILQMAQFVIILILMLVVAPLTGCETSTTGINIVIFFATLFLLLFYNFYSKTYQKKASRGEGRQRIVKTEQSESCCSKDS